MGADYNSMRFGDSRRVLCFNRFMPGIGSNRMAGSAIVFAILLIVAAFWIVFASMGIDIHFSR
jgi:hypothetical protein